MFAVTNFEGIKKAEIEIQEKHIVILLLVKPSDKNAIDIISQFNYMHYESKKYCSIYAVGYTPTGFPDNYRDVKEITSVDNETWYYSDKCFIEFKDYLESRFKWRYSGEPEVIILQSDPDSKGYLTFHNYVTIDINYGIKKEYIESFPRLMNGLINSSKTEVVAKAAFHKTQVKERFNIRNIVEVAVAYSAKTPTPVKKY